MKGIISLILLVFVCITSNGQDLKCKKFKTGTFVIPGNENIPTSTLKRSKTSQFESITKEDFMVLDIEWIDDCNYILKINIEKTPVRRITNIEKEIDKAGGLRIEMLRTANDTLFFRARATINGKEYPIDGYQIKISKDYK
ncbi:hypothetical protein A9Q86_13270 [Flavobacteriales bacterium 33_180_T64]|nr:hypothetical protein A9Q86_13270 [Flavobacteriales bacterium 33_180_T64]